MSGASAATASPAPATPAFAFVVALVGIAVFSGMDAVMKGLTLGLGAYTAMLWRCIAGTLLSGALYAARPSPWPGRAAMRAHLARGLVSAVMAVSFFWGVARVPLAQAVALSFIAPLAALFLAALHLGESIRRETIIASAIALVGVATIVAGQARADLGREALLGSAAVIFSAVCYAYNIILMRHQALLAGPIEIAFFQNLIVAGALGLAVPLLRPGAPLDHAPMLLLAAALATASLLLLSWAYARAEASYLSLTEYTAFLWAALFGFLVFGETVSPWTAAGAALIVGGCAFAAWRGAAPREPVADIEAAI